MDAVLTCYGTPAVSGIAKFNRCLAERLNVPDVRMGTAAASFAQHPLISFRPEEVVHDPLWSIRYPRYSLFLHGWTGAPRECRWVREADAVYAANAILANAIRSVRPDVITAWCPSTVQGNPTRAARDVLTFGMAHKLHWEAYRHLKILLDNTQQAYTLSVSTAIHEGSPWEAVASVTGDLRSLFGAHVRALGYLADDALARALQDCSVVALFYDPAVRANSTTYWAAREAQKLIVTTLDADSPEPASDGVYDIRTLTTWPIGHLAPQPMPGAYTWDRLLGLMDVGMERIVRA